MKEYLLTLAMDKHNNISAQCMKVLLWVLSLLYGLGVRFLAWGYEKDFLPRKKLLRSVICVGNLTLGGSGKTPLVQMIAKFCESKGIRAAILTRGYSFQKGIYDEARLLEKNLSTPVFIGKNRFQSGVDALQKQDFDLFILDDGFQHWRLRRDMDIVAIDATNPFGNKNLIPRGILREPLSALKRAQIFVLTKSDFGQGNLLEIRQDLEKLYPQAPIFESIHEPICLKKKDGDVPLSFLEGKRVCCVSGLANPGSFEKTVLSLGAKIDKHFIFQDHHAYSQEDIKRINHYCAENHIETVVVTEKDHVKLNQLQDILDRKVQVLALAIEVKIVKKGEEFERRILDLLGR